MGTSVHLPGYGLDHLRMTMTQDQSAVADDVVDVLVAVDIPLAPPFRVAHVEWEGVDPASVVGYAVGKQRAPSLRQLE